MGVQVPEGSVRVGDAMGGHGEDSAGARSGGHVDAHRPCRCVEGDGGAECGFPWGERQLDVEVAATAWLLAPSTTALSAWFLD